MTTVYVRELSVHDGESNGWLAGTWLAVVEPAGKRPLRPPEIEGKCQSPVGRWPHGAPKAAARPVTGSSAALGGPVAEADRRARPGHRAGERQEGAARSRVGGELHCARRRRGRAALEDGRGRPPRRVRPRRRRRGCAAGPRGSTGPRLRRAALGAVTADSRSDPGDPRRDEGRAPASVGSTGGVRSAVPRSEGDSRRVRRRVRSPWR